MLAISQYHTYVSSFSWVFSPRRTTTTMTFKKEMAMITKMSHNIITYINQQQKKDKHKKRRRGEFSSSASSSSDADSPVCDPPSQATGNQQVNHRSSRLNQRPSLSCQSERIAGFSGVVSYRLNRHPSAADNWEADFRRDNHGDREKKRTAVFNKWIWMPNEQNEWEISK